MGTYVALKVRNLILWEWNSCFDKNMLGFFFTDNDLVTNENKKYDIHDLDEEAHTEYKYTTTIKKAIERLDSLGFTLKKAESEFNKNKYSCLDYYDIICRLKKNTDNYDIIQEERTKKYVTFSKWRNSVLRYARYGLENGLSLRYEGEYDSYLLPKTECDKIVFESLTNSQISYYGCLYEEYNPMYTIRLILDICDPNEEMFVDITEMVGWTYSSIDDMRLDEPNEKTIVLVEGTNDKAILEFAIKHIYPHLYDLYYFMDFELDSGKKRKGGVDTILINLKAFVYSKLPSRFIGIFDNDTAGQHAMKRLMYDIGKLPDNVRAICYPNIQRANRYPTIGMNGKIVMDNINGRACSIELYLPDFLLKTGMVYPPIEWESRMKTKIGNEEIQEYQGAVSHKAEIENNFKEYKKAIEKGKEVFDANDWSEMKKLLDSIIYAFHA